MLVKEKNIFKVLVDEVICEKFKLLLHDNHLLNNIRAVDFLVGNIRVEVLEIREEYFESLLLNRWDFIAK